MLWVAQSNQFAICACVDFTTVGVQALAETSCKMLKQLIKGRDTAVQLEAGLQVVVQVQVQWPDGIGVASTGQACCLHSFIQAKVRLVA